MTAILRKWFHYVLLGLLACGQGDHPGYTLAADFDENQKIFVVYIPQPYVAELISTLSRYERVGVLVQSLDEIPAVDAQLAQFGAIADQLSYGVFPGADQWIRDSAPAILKNRNGALQAVEFLSSKKAFANNARELARSLQLPQSFSRINFQGGARESNGEGTVVVTEAFFQRHDPGFDRRRTTRDLKRDFGLKKVIWLPQGLVEDERFEDGPVYENWRAIGSGGHVDEFCRFTSSNTVLLAQVDPADLDKHPLYRVNHERLETNYRILRRHRQLEIIRAPAAELLFDTLVYPVDQKRYPVVLTASYLNFVIGNKVVIAANYYQPGMPLSMEKKG